MKTFLQTLNGAKTYIGMTIMGIVGILWSFGLITNEQASQIEVPIGVLTGYAVRHAIEKSGPKE